MKTLSAIALSCAFAMAFSATDLYAAEREECAVELLQKYMPGTNAIGKLVVKNIDIDDSHRRITVDYSKAAAYIPLTAESLESLKRDILSSFGPEYKKYKIILTADGTNLDKLVAYGTGKIVAPKERFQFVTREDRQKAPFGLDGKNIALWQSHGWYFEPKLNRWEWQRARDFQTVEDLYTQSYVIPFLMPMLENAGAYVMSPRERDTNRTEIIVDNDTQSEGSSFSTSGSWQPSGKAGFAWAQKELHNGDHPFSGGTSLMTRLSGKASASATASWNADIPEDGNYAVYISYTSLPQSSRTAAYKVYAADREHRFTINQRMGGGTWIYLGHFPLKKGERKVVELFNSGKNKKEVVTADAIKIGGGMGNVARIVKEPRKDGIDYEYATSGYPRFTEGARYFLQWAGAPDSVFTPSDYVNDYTDDYRCRGLWVNWLAGGSSVLPNRDGLGIPVDLSFAFHSDAGTTMNDSIIGTLGIYSTAGGPKKANGTDALVSRDLTNEVMTNIVDDVRATFEPNWTRRGMWDESYFEARVPEVPAMLLELLSHQNFADMKYGLDPAFRFVVSRAVYKGMLKFLANHEGRKYVVQPLPVHGFAISQTAPGNYRLQWEPTEDKTESTATPTYYIIEERLGDGAFTPVAKVNGTTFDLAVDDSEIHSYRVIAGNDGGVAFPSEVLALCYMPDSKGTVTIVNGFTRVSAPDWFDAGKIAGFYDAKDHGVPYVSDINYIGSQFEFRRDIPWMDDDAAGFGHSRSNYEDKVIAGNTFDFVALHGEAVRKAGYSFISSSVEAFCKATDTPMAVDLILGKQKEIKQGRGAYGTKFKVFPSELQNRMAALASEGTDFFVSGAFVATDIWDNPNSNDEVAEADKKFAQDILGFTWRSGQASITGQTYEVATPYREFGHGKYSFSCTPNQDCYVVESPDSFYATDSEKGCTFMRYSENNLVAGTLYRNGESRVAVIGFPFETINDEKSRDNLMKQVLDFFSK